MPITSTSIIPLASLFPELAEQEEEVWEVSSDDAAASKHDTPAIAVWVRAVAFAQNVCPGKNVVDDRKHPLHPQLVKLRGPQAIPAAKRAPKVGANARCPCGSGRKYKRCCRT